MDMFSLAGRTALVTGASRGIGQALAVGLAWAGADIIAVAREIGSLDETRAEVGKAERACHPMAADVSDKSAIDALFAQIAGRGLASDILINNAGVESVRPSADVDEMLWDKILDTNLKGAFFIAQGFARPLLAEGKPGSIVNTVSLTSEVGIPTATAYTASKSGLLGMIRALSSEWSPSGIRVNGLGPGYFRTELTETFYRDEGWQQAMLAKIPMGRFGHLEDLVGASVFLASTASAYVTGQVIYVDGGYLASI